jgi:hypothetical protein
MRQISLTRVPIGTVGYGIFRCLTVRVREVASLPSPESDDRTVVTSSGEGAPPPLLILEINRDRFFLRIAAGVAPTFPWPPLLRLSPHRPDAGERDR